MAKRAVSVLRMTCMAAVCAGMAWAQDAPPPGINLPPVPHSQRASGAAMIDVQQPGFPAEVVLSQHDASHWMMGVQIANKAKQELMSVRLGWAYALAGGLEFHASDVIAPEQGVGAGGTFSVPGEDVPVRPDAKGFLVFVEQATLADGSVANADHAAIAAFYTQCCTTAGAANKGATQAATPRSATLTEPVVRIGPKVNAQGIGMIPVLQTDMPTEFVGVTQSASDWLAGARLHNRSKYGYHTYRVGWAYVLATGVEYHSGELVTLEQNMLPEETIDVPDQHVAPRADAKEFWFFLDEATQGDGTVWRASHAKVEQQVALCCSKRDKSGAYIAAAAPAGAAPEESFSLSVPIKFDVVSFRRADKPGRGREFPAEGDFIAYHGSTIDSLLMFAYQHKGYFLVSNEPEWVKDEYWEFEAKVAPADLPTWKKMTLTEKRMMVRELLADELKLQVHEDTTEHPVFDLVVAKGGPKLKEYKPGDTLTTPNGQVLTGKVLSWFDPFNLVCQDESMADLVNSISGENRAGRIVIDKTGLTGNYNFTVPIPYTQLPEQLKQMADDSGVPSKFEGLKQVGLQLVSVKAQIDGIVVDHIERPPDN